ncbi:MAG: bifunctional tetrahydrofolate synthase/dihydrofolate synthase [Tepidimonas sp.]|uniref:bifunctional tetrahydrofolate synthase/dihydrofolate synthase n=1 Tax=Tepidimonas sp. TaxID=2002775 RepID=UPI00298F04BE|nr:bifunctional tetrahydrofolate synthase/dihydrofolate synthase [Tepidimonas sp.]MDW8335661.1 bifunctional tetrahydrofolate synthase/dihydrofolate synthase [Tepidimonas sp.]
MTETTAAGPLAPPDAAAPLAHWLDHLDRLHGQRITLGLERVRAVAQAMGPAVQPACPVVTVAGTNGKGSTCAMLEAVYRAAGYRTALYTSPHLVRFEERARLNGQPLAEAQLVPSFAAVETARQAAGDGALSYFEFTTLACVHALLAQRPDVLILEVGMGGRLDAVNVWDADVAIVTSVDLDHMEYLGPDREAIGLEKAGIWRPGRPAIVSDPMPPRSVVARALEIGADLWLAGRDFRHDGDRQQWQWQGRTRRYAGLAYPALRGANQLINAAGVLAALEALQARLPVTAQAVRQGLATVEWPGRFQVVPGQPVLVLDVAHNPHAAAALAANLDAMGFYPQTQAVFGAMADKAIEPMLRHLAPLVDRWYFCDLPTPRAAKAADLLQGWQRLGGCGERQAAQTHAGPAEALAAALAEADPAGRIVVFGSFYTVGGVLQHGLPRLGAQHLQA